MASMPRAKVDPRFEPQLRHLLSGSLLGSNIQKVSVGDFQCSRPAAFAQENDADIFKLQIPYAGYTLWWEVRFDSNLPGLAPDFLFDDDSFNLYLNMDLINQHVPSLVNWDVENPACLSNVIEQFLVLFTMYQLKQLEKDGSSLADECSKLIQQYELHPSHLQVLSGDIPVLPHCFGGSTRPNHNVVSVMILNLEDRMPHCGIRKKYQQMVLQLSCRDFSHNEALLHISPSFENILGGHSSHFAIPDYNGSEGLSEYFASLVDILAQSINQLSGIYNQHREFHIQIFLKLQGLENVSVKCVENDIPKFNLSSFIIEIDEFPVTAIFQTPGFSSGDPKVTLRTMQGKAHDIKVESPWDTEKTVESIINVCMDLKVENIDSFIS